MEYDKRKLQLKILEMAKYIDKLSRENDIEYFLIYGTCIGAVRHKGFIPWDDDFDIGMTYDNYLKFIKVCDEKLDKENYFLQTYKSEKNYYLSFAKMRDLSTTLIEAHNENIDMHKNVYIDIFPFVGYPNKNLQRKIFKLGRAFMLSANINVINNKFLYNTSRLIIKIFGKKKILKVTRKYCSKFDIKKCEYVCSVCDGDSITRNLFKKEWIEKVKYVEFEDTKLPIPFNYDEVLKTTYNDYMTIPSQEEIDNGQHNIIFLDLNLSNKEYEKKYKRAK